MRISSRQDLKGGGNTQERLGKYMAKLKHPNEKNGRTLSALDAFIVIALALCVVGAGLRIYIRQFVKPEEIKLDSYVIAFEIKDIRTTSSEHLGDGETFFLIESGEVFGEISGNVAITPAAIYVTDSEGNYVLTYSPDNGDSSRIDVSGTMTVKGCYNQNGVFLLNGTTILTPNRQFDIRSKTFSVRITVTAISQSASE